MRKTLLVVVASGALIALVPASALAKHHGARHQAHHVRSHHRRIGRDAATTSTTPTTPTPAATVASYDPTKHVLVLTLADGSTVSGTVTNDTRLVCVSPPSMTQPTSGDDDQGDQGDDNNGGDQSGGWDQSGGGSDQGGGGDQGQGDDESNQVCTTADLMPGTAVQFADLSIGQGGANWDTVGLVTTPSSTPPTVPDTDNDGN